jgi:hypothetical protein
LEHIPRVAPLDLPKEVFEELKNKYYKYNKNRENRLISPKSYQLLYPSKEVNLKFEKDAENRVLKEFKKAILKKNKPRKSSAPGANRKISVINLS